MAESDDKQHLWYTFVSPSLKSAPPAVRFFHLSLKKKKSEGPEKNTERAL